MIRNLASWDLCQPWTIWCAVLLSFPGAEILAQEAVTGDSGSVLVWRLFLVFLIVGAISLVLLGLVSLWLLYKAKNLVAQALRPDLEKLARSVTELQRQHPDLDNDQLSQRLMRKHAFQSGLVGFVTGLGGLPTLAFTLPIDVGLTIRIQASLAHQLRMLRGVPDDALHEAGLWVLTTGSQELASFSGAAVREMLVKAVSRTFLKFIPLIGGLVGFALNWVSTQALGHLVERWLRRYRAGEPGAVPTEPMAVPAVPDSGPVDNST